MDLCVQERKSHKWPHGRVMQYGSWPKANCSELLFTIPHNTIKPVCCPVPQFFCMLIISLCAGQPQTFSGLILNPCSSPIWKFSLLLWSQSVAPRWPSAYLQGHHFSPDPSWCLLFTSVMNVDLITHPFSFLSALFFFLVYHIQPWAVNTLCLLINTNLCLFVGLYLNFRSPYAVCTEYLHLNL